MNNLHPNILLVNKFFEAYSKNDQEAIKQVLSPNIEWVIPGNHPLSGTKKGVSEVLHYLSELGKAYFKAEPIVMGVNEKYVIDCHRNWSNLESQNNLDNKSCLLWEITNNVISKVINFPEDQHAVDLFFNNLYSK